jgi:hypothetical protein
MEARVGQLGSHMPARFACHLVRPSPAIVAAATACSLSAALYGMDASIIEVEVDLSGIRTNEDYFHTVGLPDAAVRESRDRTVPP